MPKRNVCGGFERRLSLANLICLVSERMYVD